MKVKSEALLIKEQLLNIYSLLFSKYGDQHWWPADTQFEVIVGAVLTQFISWRNVVKAIDNIKEKDLLDIHKLYECDIELLKELIKPAGFFNRKAVILKTVLAFIIENYDGNLDKMFETSLEVLREKLLKVRGIGPETADSILLYAGSKKIFVVDAYTIRIFTRLGFLNGTENYHQVQKFFMENLPEEVDLYNQYHALIVKLGSECCSGKKPKCLECVLKDLCQFDTSSYR
ncbi:MAG TPA: endonuclease III domain-containing protein [Acetivibrio clariflavus]|nr:endonuclease III domain-containing protein [Acetivibrio clariflavus]HPU42480.1 endonuclease III domain-containing protein [Acetivibrio clariflavus]